MNPVETAVREFPVHDAVMPSVRADSGEDGCLKARIEVIVNHEDPLGVLESLRQKCRRKYFVYDMFM